MARRVTPYSTKTPPSQPSSYSCRLPSIPVNPKTPALRRQGSQVRILSGAPLFFLMFFVSCCPVARGIRPPPVRPLQHISSTVREVSRREAFGRGPIQAALKLEDRRSLAPLIPGRDVCARRSQRLTLLLGGGDCGDCGDGAANPRANNPISSTHLRRGGFPPAPRWGPRIGPSLASLPDRRREGLSRQGRPRAAQP